MAEGERAAVQTSVTSEPAQRRIRMDGPFWLAVLLSAGGLIFLLVGSVTVMPWISRERESRTIRSIWLAFSRNLPDLGPDLLVKLGFWFLLGAIGILMAGLMVFASTVRDEPEPDTEPPA
ncbi:MAG: hypothetical protein IT334_04515 [Thermomicrobiales bacterium]|nr:hypothetical protein [Thermomicrobiales bacterium]